MSTATFTISAAHSGSVMACRIPLSETAELLAQVDGGRWNDDAKLIETMDVRESLTIARDAYRVFRTS